MCCRTRPAKGNKVSELDPSRIHHSMSVGCGIVSGHGQPRSSPSQWHSRSGHARQSPGNLGRHWKQRKRAKDHPFLHSAGIWGHSEASMPPRRLWEEHTSALSLLECPVQSQADFPKLSHEVSWYDKGSILNSCVRYKCVFWGKEEHLGS